MSKAWHEGAQELMYGVRKDTSGSDTLDGHRMAARKFFAGVTQGVMTRRPPTDRVISETQDPVLVLIGREFTSVLDVNPLSFVLIVLVVRA